MDMMSWICDANYFKNYTYPPERVLKSCHVFIEDHEETVERLLIERDRSIVVDDFINYACFEVTKACKNVDIRNLGKPKFFLDGIQQDPGMITMGFGPVPGSPEAEEAEREKKAAEEAERLRLEKNAAKQKRWREKARAREERRVKAEAAGEEFNEPEVPEEDDEEEVIEEEEQVEQISQEEEETPEPQVQEGEDAGVWIEDL